MKVKATISFSGIISMSRGEVAECPEGDVLRDLLKAGYVVPADEKATEKPESRAKKRAK